MHLVKNVKNLTYALKLYGGIRFQLCILKLANITKQHPQSLTYTTTTGLILGKCPRK